jgi:hypothetical protein
MPNPFLTVIGRTSGEIIVRHFRRVFFAFYLVKDSGPVVRTGALPSAEFMGSSLKLLGHYAPIRKLQRLNHRPSGHNPTFDH